MLSSLRYPLFLLLTLITLISADEQCQCGFSVNATTDPQWQLFTNYLETDFTKGSLDTWVPQEYSLSAAQARGPFGKNASTKNVVVGPDGVELWVRRAVNGMIPMAEIDTKRTDIVYGSFRARAKFASVNGSCGAMFWYHNNTQEIDMEFLSKQLKESNASDINLVIQSPESQAAGFDASFTAGFKLSHLPFRPDKDFHEYRFDWTPTEVAFYADGKLLYVMTQNIPTAGGKMMFNHWSNGDPGWSAGPPQEDTAMIISQAHLYFNSSDSGVQKQFNKKCPNFNATRVCTINENSTIPLMPAASQSTASSGSYPHSSTSTLHSLIGPGSTSISSATITAATTATATATSYHWFGTPTNDPALDAADKDHARIIYIVIGVVVGIVIILFIGCMITFRRWVALKNRLFGKKQDALHKSLTPPEDMHALDANDMDRMGR